MVVPFRNLNTTGEDPVESWPYEALVTTMERGMVSDWQPILTAIREQPFGRTARAVAGYVKSDPDDQPAAAFFALALNAPATLWRKQRRRSSSLGLRQPSSLQACPNPILLLGLGPPLPGLVRMSRARSPPRPACW